MASRDYYTHDEQIAAQNVNISDFLQSHGYELIRHGNCFKSKLHDSLNIRDDGRWFWNSKDLHGYLPVELYKQILIHDFGYGEKEAYIEATKQLAEYSGTCGSSAVFSLPASKNNDYETAVRPPGVPVQLSTRNANNDSVIKYLCEVRGLERDIVNGLIKYNKIYEDKYHNAVFVSYDRNNMAQNAFLRGTLPDRPFKKDVELSDKSYPFTLLGYASSNKVFCFESAVDSISHASIYRNNGLDWRDGHRISLGGTAFRGLRRFLDENPQVRTVISCLDNDDTGNSRSETMISEFTEKGYEVRREAPIFKDFNEDLLHISGSLDYDTDLSFDGEEMEAD